MRNKDEIIKTLLAKRRIVKDEKVTEYLSLLPQKTYDPFLMLGMKEAVDIILVITEYYRLLIKPLR